MTGEELRAMSTADLERLAAEQRAMFHPDSCPAWARDSIDRYVQHGIPTGGCLRAVLSNDLMQAFSRADVETAKAMASIVSYIHNRVPGMAHGSEARVDAWIAARRKIEAGFAPGDPLGEEQP
jgi:hypothetical protein